MRVKFRELRRKLGGGKTLAIVLPFLAALMLGFGKRPSAASAQSGLPGSLTYPAESQAEKWTAPIVGYLTRLVISFLGTLGFLLCLLLIGFVSYKLRIHAGSRLSKLDFDSWNKKAEYLVAWDWAQ